MKIFIITFHSTTNMGGVIQAYALFKYLKNIGHEVQVIDYRPAHISNIQSPYKSIITTNPFKAIFLLPGRLKKFKKFNEFTQKYISLTKRCINVSSLEQLDKADIYITGSDQVWNHEITGGFDPGFYLEFVKNGKKVSYAASVGNDNPADRDIQEIAERIKEFDAVSVREKDLKERLQRLVKKDIIHVLDPVFLLDKEDYKQIQIPPNIDRYVFIYELQRDSRLGDIAKKIAAQYGLKVVHFPSLTNSYGADEIYKDIGPSEFLGLLNNAEYVVTSSFHGVAFSIRMEKQFYCIPVAKRNSRIESLLELIGLESRSITDSITLKIEHIDYDKVNNIVASNVQLSEGFLLEAIK